jgi:hypothetical protein
MMWAADFEHASTRTLEYQSLEALQLQHPLPDRSFPPEDEVEACRVNHSPELSSSPTCTTLQRLHTCETSGIESLRWKALASKTSFCGLRPGRLWHKNRNRTLPRNAGLLERRGDEDISVFCVAAIIEQNRNMLFNKLQSMDDAIKVKLLHSNIQRVIDVSYKNIKFSVNSVTYPIMRPMPRFHYTVNGI